MWIRQKLKHGTGLTILSYITNIPILTLAKLIFGPSIKSFHIFRHSAIMLAYLYGYSIGYSFFGKSMLWR